MSEGQTPKIFCYKQEDSDFPAESFQSSGLFSKVCTAFPKASKLKDFTDAVLIIKKEEDFSFLETLPSCLKINIIFENFSLGSSGKLLCEEVIFKSGKNLNKIFFTSVTALRQFRMKFKELPANYLPWPVFPCSIFGESKSSLDLAEEKTENLSSQDVLTVSLVSKPQIEWRAHKLFDAISSLEGRREVLVNWLIEKSEIPAASQLLNEFGIKNFKLYLNRAPSSWLELIATSDVCFHKHFSARHFPSIYLYLSLSEGKKVIVSDIFDGELLKGNQQEDSQIEAISPGFSEAKNIADFLEKSFLDKSSRTESSRTEISSPALQSFIKEAHSKEIVENYLMCHLS